MVNDRGGKWSGEKAALKKIQLHFSFQQERNDQIQHDAIDVGIKPSDMIRKIVGLPFKKIQRPRIGLSLDDMDLQFLAEKYGISADNEAEIKRKVTEEVNLFCTEKE
jgi:di/tripeptidase